MLVVPLGLLDVEVKKIAQVQTNEDETSNVLDLILQQLLVRIKLLDEYGIYRWMCIYNKLHLLVVYNLWSMHNLWGSWRFYKLHHEVELDIWGSLGLGPIRTLWHFDTFKTLTLIQISSPWVVQITMESNSTAPPAPGLRLCFRHEPFSYPQPSKLLSNCHIWNVCYTRPVTALKLSDCC